jgi:hypothetical protein
LLVSVVQGVEQSFAVHCFVDRHVLPQETWEDNYQLLLNELILLHNCLYIIYYHMSSSTVISCRDIIAPTDDSIVNAISNADAAVA